MSQLLRLADAGNGCVSDFVARGELDIISGFLMNPLPLLDHGEAELAIIHDPQEAHPSITFSPCFAMKAWR